MAWLLPWSQEEAGISTISCEVRSNHGSSPSRTSRLQDAGDGKFAPKDVFEDADIDDELDPAMKEELDKLVSWPSLTHLPANIPENVIKIPENIIYFLGIV